MLHNIQKGEVSSNKDEKWSTKLLTGMAFIKMKQTLKNIAAHWYDAIKTKAQQGVYAHFLEALHPSVLLTIMMAKPGEGEGRGGRWAWNQGAEGSWVLFVMHSWWLQDPCFLHPLLHSSSLPTLGLGIPHSTPPQVHFLLSTPRSTHSYQSLHF